MDLRQVVYNFFFLLRRDSDTQAVSFKMSKDIKDPPMGQCDICHLWTEKIDNGM